MSTLIYDTETNGMVLWDQQSDHPNQPRLVQFGGILDDKDKKPRAIFDFIVKPAGWTISPEVAKIHGITHEMAMDMGLQVSLVADLVMDILAKTQLIVCHNVKFDTKIIKILAHVTGRPELRTRLEAIKTFCTMQVSTPICKVPGGKPYKWPKLQEAYTYFFKEQFDGAHTALADAKACRRIYHELTK